MNDIEAAKNLLFRIGSEVANEAKENSPYKTGNLRRDIQVFTENLDDLEISIGNTNLTPYAIFVHQGTGIHGKKKRRIKPTKAKALKTPFGYKKSVEGQKAQPYLTDGLENYINNGGLDRALDAVGDEISKELVQSLKKSLKNMTID